MIFLVSSTWTIRGHGVLQAPSPLGLLFFRGFVMLIICVLKKVEKSLNQKSF